MSEKQVSHSPSSTVTHGTVAPRSQKEFSNDAQWSFVHYIELTGIHWERMASMWPEYFGESRNPSQPAPVYEALELAKLHCYFDENPIIMKERDFIDRAMMVSVCLLLFGALPEAVDGKSLPTLKQSLPKTPEEVIARVQQSDRFLQHQFTHHAGLDDNVRTYMQLISDQLQNHYAAFAVDLASRESHGLSYAVRYEQKKSGSLDTMMERILHELGVSVANSEVGTDRAGARRK